MTKCDCNEICSRQTDFEAGIASFRSSPAFDSGLSIQKVRRNTRNLINLFSTKVFPTFIGSTLSDIYKVLLMNV